MDPREWQKSSLWYHNLQQYCQKPPHFQFNFQQFWKREHTIENFEAHWGSFTDQKLTTNQQSLGVEIIASGTPHPSLSPVSSEEDKGPGNF